MSTQIAKIDHAKESSLMVQRLDPQQQKIVKFFDAPTVKEINKDDLCVIVDTAITKVFSDLGRVCPPEDDMDYMVKELVNALKYKYLSLRVTEIKVAFERGVRREYGEYFGVNAAELERFLKAYFDDYNRKSAMKAYLAVKEAAKVNPEPTEEDKKQIINGNIVNAFETFKKNNWFEDVNNIIFIHLHKNGFLEFSDAELISFYNEAKARLLNYYSSDTIGITFFEKRNAKAKIKRLNEITGPQMLQDKEIVCMANKVALNYFFKRMVQIGTDIKELLEFI